MRVKSGSTTVKLPTIAPLLTFSGIVSEDSKTFVGASGTSRTNTTKGATVDILGTPSSVHLT